MHERKQILFIQSIAEDRHLENDEESSEDEENDVIEEASKWTSSEPLASLETERNLFF